MNQILRRIALPLLLVLILFTAARSEDPKPAAPASDAAPDLTRQPTLYVVPYAHLDTQWRWEYPQVIREYLPKTMRDNFALFEKYPHYVFNFSGANRYRMMKEYYPTDYKKIQQYVAAGRWFPAGSSMEENDVNNPSGEAILRQVLYGKELFRRDFNKTSAEYMLPDCFGFPASLPSILTHAGIKGFSTQKLSWHSGARAGGPNSPQQTPEGIPFNVGVWEGTDGKTVFAALNAMTYSGDVVHDITKTPPVDPAQYSQVNDWVKRVNINGNGGKGLFTDFYYYGTGDTGGSPREHSVKLMEAILTKSETTLPMLRPNGRNAQAVPASGPVRVGDGPLAVRQVSAEQLFLDLKPEDAPRLPHWKGDIELTEHSAGSLTSEAYQKRWNRRNETMADAAERASVAAEWLGGRPYPLQRLTDAWTLVMGGQFHDLIPGTATPRAFEFAWNDDTIAANQFTNVFASGSAAVISAMDTQTRGTPIVVFNPLNISREDVVEAPLPAGMQSAHVIGADGKEVPSQVSNGKLIFLANVPSVGYAAYDVTNEAPAAPAKAAAKKPSTGAVALQATDSSLENARYRISINKDGDIASIFDKQLNKELLASPARLALTTDHPVDWPAWNIDWADQSKPPRAYVSGPAKIRVVESGPVRVAVEIERETEGSKFVQTIRLAAGSAGDRIEFANVIDWQTKEANLKASFPLTASNPEATYNWDFGTIQRGNNDEKKFEVASHQWLDLTNKSGAFGVTLLTDAKNGSDKPNDNTVRLTLIRTPGLGHHEDGRPGNGTAYDDQLTQDWGHHEFSYGFTSHAGDWRAGQTDWQGWRLNQPLIAFTSGKHAGALGKSFSLVRVNNPRVRVLALKKAQQGDDYVVRIIELDGKSQPNVKIGFAAPVTSVREINGAEEPVGEATATAGEIVTSLGPYQPRTFAFRLSPATAKAAPPQSTPLTFAYDQTVATPDNRPSVGGFDGIGRAYPAEMLPRELEFNGVRFNLAPAGTDKANAVSAHGQTINLPSGSFNRVVLLAAASEGDAKAAFKIGDAATELNIQDWSGFIGQWDVRQWRQTELPPPPEPAAGDMSPEAQRARRIRDAIRRNGPRLHSDYAGLEPGFIKTAPLAWYASHRHNSDGANEPYSYSYLFAYVLDVPAGAKTITLPDNDRIRIFAATAVNDASDAQPAQSLFDLEDRSKVAAGFYGRLPANK